MDLQSAIRAIAPRAPQSAIDGLEAARPQLERIGALATPNRAAHMLGQCAHESAGFTRLVESLFYSSGERILAVFGPRRFAGLAEAESCARNQRKLADRVYCNRMGNGDAASGDGFRYRGRGYLQLTGRGNYRVFGKRIGVDLEADPRRAAEPQIAWLIAGTYLATRSRAGRTALDWADADNVEMVTRIVNGGTTGLEARRHLTALARTALGAPHPALARGAAGPEVRLLQTLLARNDCAPGAIDGAFGGRTEAALRRFQAACGLPRTGVADATVWQALEKAAA